MSAPLWLCCYEPGSYVHPAQPASGFAGRLRLCHVLGLRQLLDVQRVKINRFKHQWRVACVADGVGNDSACKWEHQPRCFAKQKRMCLFFGYIAQTEQGAVIKLDGEMHAIVALCFDSKLQGNFMNFIGDCIGLNVNLNINL